MGPIDLLNHLLNFALPAAFVALLVSVTGRWVVRPAPRAPRGWALVAIHFAVGLAVLVAGVVLFGRDGKLVTYAALVLAVASSHWIVSRGWR